MHAEATAKRREIRCENARHRKARPQLVSGGMLIAPVMVGETECRMLKLTKTGSRFDREDLFAVPYLPIVPQVAQAL